MKSNETCGNCHHFKPSDEVSATHGYCKRAYDPDDHRYIAFEDRRACPEFILKTRTDLCIPGRAQHRFRSRKTHGKLTITSHGDYTCRWCKKTFAEVMREKRKNVRK